MISFITTVTDRPVCAGLGVSVLGTGMPSAAFLPAMRERGERPTRVPAAAAARQAYAFAAATGAGNQHTQHIRKWTFRGLEPWSEPA